MIGAPEGAIKARATRLVDELAEAGLTADLEPVQATVGGGSLPGETLLSWAVTLTPALGEGVDRLARRLRLGDPGIFGRIDRDRLLLDLRTVLPEDDETLARSLRRSLSSSV
jgi:L-seryl-tRNA(Ser) seleniumtransferase